MSTTRTTLQNDNSGVTTGVSLASPGKAGGELYDRLVMDATVSYDRFFRGQISLVCGIFVAAIYVVQE